MAISMGSFSIREYAARMRREDVLKCWPFEEAEEEIVRSILPPITIKKFRWWFDELELVRSNSTGYDFGECSEKNVEDEDEEDETIESMRMKMIRKNKVKTPKKRSIVEIFAVSPQVERVISDDNDDDDDEDEDGEDSDNDIFRESVPNSESENTKKVKKKKKKGSIASMLEKQKKVVKKKKMKKNVAIKENSSRLKLISSVGSAASSKESTHDTRISTDSSHGKDPRPKCLTSEKRSKTLKTSKLLEKKKKMVLPMRGLGKKSTSCFSQDDKVKKCNSQNVNTHVTFSEKNRDLGLRTKTNSTLELEFQKFCNVSCDVASASEVNDHSSERGEGLTIHQMEEAEEENDNCKENEIKFEPVTGMQFSVRYSDDHVSGEENFLSKSVALSSVENPQHLEGCNRGKVHDSLYTYSTPPISQEDRIHELTSPVSGNPSDASTTNGPFLGSGYFTDFLKSYPNPPNSYKSIFDENANCRHHFPSRITTENYNDHSLQYQWLPHLSPKELMQTICALPDWKSKVAISGETSMNADLIGLPLNSQGELIRLNSNVDGRFDQLRDASTLLSPSTGSAMHNNVPPNFMVDKAYFRSKNEVKSLTDQPRMRGIGDFGREMENLLIPSRLDTMEQCYGSSRTNIMMTGYDPSVYALESDMDLTKMLYNRSGQDQPTQKHPGNPNHISLQISQSTMRLMGQEFKVGGNELQELEDREIWMDKQRIKEQHANNVPLASYFRSHGSPDFPVHPISTKLKNPAIHLSETRPTPASGSVSHMMVPESRIFSQFLQSQDNVVLQDGFAIGKGKMAPEIYPYFAHSSSPFPGSGKTMCQDPFLYGYKSSTASQMRVPSSLFQDTTQNTQNMGRSYVELKKKQKPPYTSNMAFRFPFSHKEHGKHIQPPGTQNSVKVMAPWWLDSKQKASVIDYNQTYSSPGISCHDWSISGIDHQVGPSVYPNLEPFYTFPHGTLHNSYASSSLVHCPMLPVQPGIPLDSVSLNGYAEKMKSENFVKPRIGVRFPNHVRRSKKRLASNDDAKLTKVPKLGIHEDSRRDVTALKTSPIFEHDVQCSKEVLDSGRAKDIANTIYCRKNAAHKDDDKVCCGMVLDELQDAPRSGPTKHTPGARHVLKPCQTKEQTNSKPSHSSIPFAEMTKANGVLASEKSAKIYRF